MKSIEINSPCKINFGLNVVRKREDGFHDIETVFMPIDLADKIYFKISAIKSFRTNNAQLNEEGNNLITKAIALLEEKFGREFNLEIRLEKNIPLGAGLGGGSSNAAVTLLSVIELLGLELSQEELNYLALKLGSDVPFFLQQSACFATSRGEILTPINFEMNLPVLIVNPGIHISTKWAYQNVTPANPVYSLKNLAGFDMTEIGKLTGKVVNDFEPKCFEAFPELKTIKENLYSQGALFALMTGSGSSMFGVFPDYAAALEAEKIYKDRFFTYINFNQ
jgi:4-diphosphocytidyl-2-C-methyl-D-erythritol kinase